MHSGKWKRRPENNLSQGRCCCHEERPLSWVDFVSEKLDDLAPIALERDLHNCYWNSLQLAAECGIHSIAFPAISTGVYGYPISEATQIAISAVSEWFAQHPNYDMQVIFSCFGTKLFQTYKEELEKRGKNNE